MTTKVMLRTRDLGTGTATLKECDNVDSAVEWLKARPRMIEVLGVVFEGISKEENERMKTAMRPLDPDERERAMDLESQEAKRREERAAAKKLEAAAEEARAREAAKTADPARPMEVVYRYDREELKKSDGLDDREINQTVIDAVKAWVVERNEWVEGRGQVVGEAKVTLYPGDVPKGKDRVVVGTFVPVTAPAKEEAKP